MLLVKEFDGESLEASYHDALVDLIEQWINCLAWTAIDVLKVHLIDGMNDILVFL